MTYRWKINLKTWACGCQTPEPVAIEHESLMGLNKTAAAIAARRTCLYHSTELMRKRDDVLRQAFKRWLRMTTDEKLKQIAKELAREGWTWEEAEDLEGLEEFRRFAITSAEG